MSRTSLWAGSLALGIGSAVAYGLVHDQISVRISPAYLMDWHPQLIESRNPVVVALLWGVVATWWFGLILGAVLALAATVGSRPMAPWAWIVRAVLGVFVVASVSAGVAFGITKGFGLSLPASFHPVYEALSPSERLAFTQTAAMHETSYDAAAIATLLAAILIAWGRRRLAVSA